MQNLSKSRTIQRFAHDPFALLFVLFWRYRQHDDLLLGKFQQVLSESLFGLVTIGIENDRICLVRHGNRLAVFT